MSKIPQRLQNFKAAEYRSVRVIPRLCDERLLMNVNNLPITYLPVQLTWKPSKCRARETMLLLATVLTFRQCTLPLVVGIEFSVMHDAPASGIKGKFEQVALNVECSHFLAQQAIPG